MSDLSRLLWKCRRGTREMDLLLENFLHKYYSKLSDKEKLVFDSLLDEADPDIYSWVMDRSEPGDPAYKPLLEKLQTINGKK